MAFKEPSCLKRELLKRQSNLPFARNCYRFFVLIFGWRGNGFFDSLAFFVNRFWLPKSCLSIFTHGQTPTTPKQLIMYVEVMLRNMARLNRCINYCSFIWGGQSQMAYLFYCFVWEVISKTRASGFIRGSPNTLKQWKHSAYGLVLSCRAFICFSAFGTPDETLALVFNILLQKYGSTQF